MASLVAKALVKRTFLETATKNLKGTNPFEEEIPVVGKDGRPTGKIKTKKRALPATISAHDGNVLKKVRRRAWRLDMSLFNCCGLRFGWSSVIGIVPVIGDAIDAALALMVVRTCEQIEGGLPPMLRSRMYFNIILDFALGLIPFIGDIADAVYRANTRNCWLLEVYLTEKAKALQTNHLTDPDSGIQLLPAQPKTTTTNQAADRSILPAVHSRPEHAPTHAGHFPGQESGVIESSHHGTQQHGVAGSTHGTKAGQNSSNVPAGEGSKWSKFTQGWSQPKPATGAPSKSTNL